MSALVERVLMMGRPPIGTWSYSLWVPLLGALWVAANLILLALGTQIAHPMSCSFAAGIIDGTIFSVIAVARASVRFQAGTTGLLGGLTLSGLRNDGSMIWKFTQGLHAFVDQALHGLGIDGEQLHGHIEQEVLYIIWTTVFVVLASLVTEWVRATKSEAAALDAPTES
jgi:hypothetical protein